MARLIFAVLACAAAAASASRFIMPWMCLERCGGNQTSIQAALDDFKVHSQTLTAVSFEVGNIFNASRPAALTWLRTEIQPWPKLYPCTQQPDKPSARNQKAWTSKFSHGLQLPLPEAVHVWPAPSLRHEYGQVLYVCRDWMRQVFTNPKPFIHELVGEIEESGFSGVNMYDLQQLARGSPN